MADKKEITILSPGATKSVKITITPEDTASQILLTAIRMLELPENEQYQMVSTKGETIPDNANIYQLLNDGDKLLIERFEIGGIY